ncbi:hypothetical protein B5V89_14190 [Heyndrickxia sporothermodurans]|uniref:hypothetical protein n=1 Tax=Heyndrickxia TaxID=2837504 RepID=UPI000D3B7E65|nr:hypothetical protein [Heyndrickxia sporothermodurans]PTY77595.1 hypothetical protein B5V89_14190 [Heyndrickxia sporothermodurans]
MFKTKNGFRFFLQSNLVLCFMILLLFVNYKQWGSDGSVTVIIFILGFEFLIILLSILACFSPKTNEANNQNKTKRKWTKNEFIAMILALFVCTLIALPFLGINISIPSSYVSIILIANCIFAFFSIFVQKAVMILYQSNVHNECKSILDFFYKYMTILFSGINYHGQKVLSGLPFALNKLFAIVFLLVLLWQFFIPVGIFEQ